MSPHRYVSIDVDQLEVTALGHPLLSLVRIVDLNLEVSVGLLLRILAIPGSKFGVGGKGRACDVVSEESGVGHDVAKSDHVVMSHHATSTSRRDLLRRLDDPMIVGIVEGVSSDLLACDTRSGEPIGPVK